MNGNHCGQLLRFGDSELFALAGRACQLQHFLETHQYCGKVWFAYRAGP